MKKNPLLLALLLAFAFAVSSCNNDDDPAPPPVVGVWELDRYEISDLPAAFSTLNGVGYDNQAFLEGSRIEVKNDRTFSEISRSQGFVFDLDGTWEYTTANNTSSLNLNYSNADIDDIAYTYNAARNRLYGEKVQIADSLFNQSTRRSELVRFNIQQVYIKK